MAKSADQIEAEIVQTRRRMETKLDSIVPTEQGTLSSVLTTGIAEQIRQRPLAAIGLSLLVGGLVQALRAGGASGAPATAGGQSLSTGTSGSTIASAPRTTSTGGDGAGVAGAVTDAAQSAKESVTGAARQAAGTASDAARDVTHAFSDAAHSVTQGVSAAAEQAGSTGRQVAQTVSSAAGSVTSGVSDRASGASGQVSGAVGGVVESVGEQVRRRPLVALGLSIGAGALLQPVIAPRVTTLVQSLGGGAGQAALGQPSATAAIAAPPSVPSLGAPAADASPLVAADAAVAVEEVVGVDTETFLEDASLPPPFVDVDSTDLAQTPPSDSFIVQDADAAGTDVDRLPLYEEDLTAGVVDRDAGEIRITKDVVEEPRTIEVPVEHERVEIHSVSVDASVADPSLAFQGESVVIPVREEAVEVTKETRLAEEIAVEKDVVRDVETVSDMVRSERLDVEQLGPADTPQDAAGDTDSR